MKFIIVAALALVAVVSCAPAQPDDVKIIRSDIDQQPDGAYNFNLETSDGTSRQETGELKEVRDEENKPQNVVVVRGSYQYVDSEGKTHVVTYFADETGYHAEGDDIPKDVPARR